MVGQIDNIKFNIFVAGFISAIFIGSFLRFGFSFFLFLLLISFLIFLYQKYFLVNINNRKVIIYLALFIFSFSLGVLRYEIKNSTPLDPHLETFVGDKVSISGIIIAEPQKKEKFNELTVKFTEISQDASSTEKVYGIGLVQTDFYPEFEYGDLIKISGKLGKPENIEKNDGREFDYVAYLGKDGIEYTINFAKAELVSHGHGNLIKGKLFDIKNAFIKNIEKTIPEPQSSLLGGILLGAKNSMSSEVWDSFKISGLSHIVALSGYNITIVAESIMNILYFLPRAFAFSGGVLGIIAFVVMSGASSTAVRASIMALIVILAKATNRNYKIGRALVVAGLLMIIYNPKILVFDISFQLSFIATIAIIFVSPILKERLSFITEKFALRENISATISAQILVLPLILYQMGLLSLVALPANILIVSVIPFLMFFGFFAGFVGFINVFVSLPFAWVSWFVLTYILKVSDLFAGLPFSSIEIKAFSSVTLFFAYFILFLVFLFLKKEKPHKT